MAPITYDFLERARQLAKPPPPGAPYSLPIDGTEKDGRSKVYRHWRFTDGLMQTIDPTITTLHEMFEQTASRLPTSRCLGHRPYDPATKTFGPYQWMDYQTLQRRRAEFGAGLVELHKKVGVLDTEHGVGLWCQNRPEWQITDLACMSQNLFTVSIYDTLGPDTTEYIINHAALPCVVTSLPHIPTLLKLKPRLPTLKLIISLDPLDSGERPGESKAALLGSLAADFGVSIHYIEDVESLGRTFPRSYVPPQPESIATINYTSGTTGNPKGVVLTHANAVSAASTSLIIIPQHGGDSLISYLPLAHIYQRVGEHAALWGGTQIGYFHGNILELVDDLKVLRPTIFQSVPRLYNRFGGAIKAATVEQAGVKGALARHIVSTKLATLHQPPGKATNKHAVYDRIWGRKVASALGLDRAKIMVSGSAPLDPSLQQFLRVVLGNHLFQGYGLTETYAATFAQLDGDMSAGNCGTPAPCIEACLLDVPDMDYLSSDKPYPRGELLLRGPARFKEYYRDEQETSKVILEDGWFRTGDICSIDEMGRFTIIDRVKNVLKLAQGEYISPERIENVFLSHCSYLAQAYVHGDSVQPFLVAIFGVNPELFAPFASKVLGKTTLHTDLQAINAAAQDLRVRKAVLKDLERVAKKNKFNSYEKVKNCYLYLDPFTIDNELLTPTLKLKRPQTAKKFRADLDRLYDEGLAEGAAAAGKMKARL
ncbi:MAG: hypothetical protein M1836_002941 [Candelina mexicana]|nr:MAG: hypothetical protein M1836_002941 [Candelina mexicana]